MKTSSQRSIRPLAFSAVICAAALLGPTAGVQAQPNLSNGDVNGSGVMDLSDVIYLANYLFLGGPPPSTIVCATGSCDADGGEAVFEDDAFRPLDLQRAAEEEHGSGATLISTGDHLYDWKVRVGRETRGLDLTRAVADQYGSGYRLVTVGVHKFDWKAVRLSAIDHRILPVVLISSDRFYDVAGVARAVARYRSAMGRVQTWYNQRVGAELRMLQPIVIGTTFTGAQWDAISASTAIEEHRFDLFTEAVKAYEASLPAAGEDLRVVLSPYTGESADVWLGAAASGAYAVAPQRATSLDCPATGPLDPACADAAYAIGHELGHTLGLDHSCDAYPEHGSCGSSIMQTAKPPQAILLQQEICTLLASPFFHSLSAMGLQIVEEPRDRR